MHVCVSIVLFIWVLAVIGLGDARFASLGDGNVEDRGSLPHIDYGDVNFGGINDPSILNELSKLLARTGDTVVTVTVSKCESTPAPEHLTTVPTGTLPIQNSLSQVAPGLGTASEAPLATSVHTSGTGIIIPVSVESASGASTAGPAMVSGNPVPSGSSQVNTEATSKGTGTTTFARPASASPTAPSSIIASGYAPRNDGMGAAVVALAVGLATLVAI